MRRRRLEHALEAARLEVGDWCVVSERGVVDEHVDGAVRLAARSRRVLDVADLRDVGATAVCFATAARASSTVFGDAAGNL